MNSTSIAKIEQEAKEKYYNFYGAHDFEHIERVNKLAIHIGKIEKADLAIVKLAALLHDIGRAEQDRTKGKVCHAEYGARLAREMLERYKVKPEAIEAITHCIEAHRLGKDRKPETIEAKVLYDADTIDSLGAIGLGRLFFFAAKNGSKVHNKNVDLADEWEYTTEDTPYRYFLDRQQNIVEKMMTKEGKKIAKNRFDFMTQFFDRLNKEVEGEL